MKLKHYSLAAITAAALGSLAASASADVITDWNLITVNATKVAPALNSNLASRIDAIEAIAVYDAVNSIKQFGSPYHYYSPNTGSALAAAAQAAHDVLTNYFPAQITALDSNLVYSLSNITDGPIGNGQSVGSAAAADIIALRANDGSALQADPTDAGPLSAGAAYAVGGDAIGIGQNAWRTATFNLSSFVGQSATLAFSISQDAAPNDSFLNDQLAIDHLQVVPEPTTGGLLAGGLALLAINKFRRKNS
jgi:hypothetical protein